jgi:O-antigen biosynthesis protein
MSSWLDPLKRRAVLWNRRRLHQRMQARMPSYAAWSAQFDALDSDTLAALQTRLEQLPQRPAVCLALPCPTGSVDRQCDFLAALQAQLYPHWQLRVSLPAGSDEAVVAFWLQQAAGETRVHVLRGAPEGAAGRTALLAACSSPWLVFVDDAEQWRPHTLLLLVEAAVQRSGVALVYADEDRIDGAGQRHDPQFKCDWNPDLLLSHDCIGRPAMWHAEHLRSRWPQPEEPKPEAEHGAAWRHDLALRGTAGLAAAAVQHVPHVLCHRAATAATEPTASVSAVQAHLDRIGEAGCAEPMPGFDGVRVRFALPVPAPHVTLVIPTRNGLALLRQCVNSILQRTHYAAYDIVIIDNGSDDPACLAWMRQAAMADARVSVRRDDGPFNFAALNNAAIAEARGEFVALVNNDIEVISPDWLEEMVSLAARPGVGAVGARLWYSDRTLQHGGVIIGIGGAAGHAHKRLTREQPGMMGRAQRLQMLSAVTAACLVVRRAHWQAVGGMDAEAFAVAFNDVDFCLRLRERGLRNLWTPFAELFHHESVSRGSDRRPEKKERFERERSAMQARWGASLQHDPAYNPNLTFNNENFALASPPRVSLRAPWFRCDTTP